MTEIATVEATPKVPAEVLADVTAQHAELEKIKDDMDLLVLKAQELKVLPENADKNGINPSWLLRKLKYHVQSTVYAAAGIVETPKIKERKAKVDAGEGNTPTEGKPGRKRMSKDGEFALALGDPPNFGRESSARAQILKQLAALGRPFKSTEFDAAVAVAMGYDAENKTFGRDTKFPTIEACANAWFSQLVNKDKVIVRAA